MKQELRAFVSCLALVALTIGVAGPFDSLTLAPFDSRVLAQGGQGQPQQQPPPPPPAEQPPPAQPQPTFKTGINFVRVDVIVSDKSGNPVYDLKQVASGTPIDILR